MPHITSNAPNVAELYNIIKDLTPKSLGTSNTRYYVHFANTTLYLLKNLINLLQGKIYY